MSQRPPEEFPSSPPALRLRFGSRRPQGLESRFPVRRVAWLVGSVCLVLVCWNLLLVQSRRLDQRDALQARRTDPSAHADPNGATPRHLPEGVFQIPGEVVPQAVSPSAVLHGVDPSLFEVVQDDTVFRAAESPAWFRTLQRLKQVEAEELSKKSLGEVTYSQLWLQPQHFRGRLVTVFGTLRRAVYVAAPPNEFGVEGYWQCWIQPHGVNSPVVAYTPVWPDGIESGMAIEVEAGLVGVFFKRWAYPSLQGIRTAPVILGLLSQKDRLLMQMVDEQMHRDPALLEVPGVASHDPGQGDAHPALPGDLPADEFPDVREYLALLGIEQDSWEIWRDHTELNDAERSILHRLMLASMRLPWSTIQRWTSPDKERPRSESERSSARCHMFMLQGQVRSVRSWDIPPDEAERLGFSRYFECRFVPDGKQDDLRIYTPHVPQAWQAYLDGDLPIAQRIRGPALYLKQDGDGRDLFLAPRLAWHPQAPSETLGVSADQVLLARFGFDLSTLDPVEDRLPLRPEDRDAFYGLLEVVHRAGADSLEKVARPIAISKLLQAEAAQRGSLFTLTGTARRIVKIATEPEIRQRWGISEYFEIQVFVEPDASIRLRFPDGTSKEFSNYPVTFCCRTLAKGVPQGEDLSIPVTVSGAYLKQWAFPSRFASSETSPSGETFLQSGPLLIGAAPRLVPLEPFQVPELGPWLIGFCFAVLLGSILLAAFFVRDDRRRDRAVHRVREAASAWDGFQVEEDNSDEERVP